MDSCCYSRVKEPKSYGPKPKQTEDAAFEVPHYQRVSTEGEGSTGVSHLSSIPHSLRFQLRT